MCCIDRLSRQTLSFILNGRGAPGSAGYPQLRRRTTAGADRRGTAPCAAYSRPRRRAPRHRVLHRPYPEPSHPQRLRPGCGPKHSVKKGKTPVLTTEEARNLLDSIVTDTRTGRQAPGNTLPPQARILPPGLRHRPSSLSHRLMSQADVYHMIRRRATGISNRRSYSLDAVERIRIGPRRKFFHCCALRFSGGSLVTVPGIVQLLPPSRHRIDGPIAPRVVGTTNFRLFSDNGKSNLSI